MIYTIYAIILLYFLAGGIGFYAINRKKDPSVAKKSYLKFFTYFIIINVLFFSIALAPLVFRIIVGIIILGGFFELINLYGESGYSHKMFFILSILIFSVLAVGLFAFSGLDSSLVLFSLLVLSIFDSFSQITGQLWGKKNPFPQISPNKTVGGLAGGAVVALVSAYLLRSLPSFSVAEALMYGTAVVIFAFFGDLAASYYKRTYQTKDFSRMIPGHGGILDRFDSLVAGGAAVAFFELVLKKWMM